jgi:transglutaminase-like putative cysteine protease
MRLSIGHRTRYRYRSPVTLLPHRLMLSPRAGHTVTPISASISCTPEAHLLWTQDLFGNLIATASFEASVDELVILGQAVVDLTASEWPVFEVDPSAHSYPFAYSLDDVIDLGRLSQPDWLDPDASSIASWAQAFGQATSDTLSLLKLVNSSIQQSIAYRVRDEEGTQSPQETLSLASGSCRDIAALFIEAVRHLGFGARAVSGYLYDAALSGGSEGSTHAWAEVYLPAAGWIAFDPTHGRVGSANLIPVGVARSIRQIMPIVGGYLGNAEDAGTMEVAVRVTEIATEPTASGIVAPVGR